MARANRLSALLRRTCSAFLLFSLLSISSFAQTIDNAPGTYALSSYTLLGGASQSGGTIKLTDAVPDQNGNAVSEKGFCANEWEITWEANAGADGVGTGAGVGMFASNGFHEVAEWLDTSTPQAVNALKSFAVGVGTSLDPGRPSDNHLELVDYVDPARSAFLNNPFFRFKGLGWFQNTFHFKQDGTAVYTVRSPDGKSWSISGRVAHQPALPFHIGFNGRTNTNKNIHQVRNVGFRIINQGNCGIISSDEARVRLGMMCGFDPPCSNYVQYLDCASRALVQLRDDEQVITQGTFDLLSDEVQSRMLYCDGYNECSATMEEVKQTAYDQGFTAGAASIDQAALVESGRAAGYSSGYSAGYSAGESAGFLTGKSAGYSEGFAAGTTSGFDSGKSIGYTEGYSAGSTAGYESGKTFGYSEGYSAGSSAGFESGKIAGFSEGFTLGENSGFQSGKLTGYSEGYQDGRTSGLDEGYTEGFQAGELNGKELGFSEGYSVGDAAGFDRGVTAGYSTGYSEGTANLEQAKTDSYNLGFEAGRLSMQQPQLPAPHNLCSLGATEVLFYAPGPSRRGKPLEPSRSDPKKALGLPESQGTMNYVSLGRGGVLELGFGGRAVFNRDGFDLFIVDSSHARKEKDSEQEVVEAFASSDGRSWTRVGMFSGSGGIELGSLSYATQIRLIDRSSEDDTNGFDLNGFGCSIPSDIKSERKKESESRGRK